MWSEAACAAASERLLGAPCTHSRENPSIFVTLAPGGRLKVLEESCRTAHRHGICRARVVAQMSTHWGGGTPAAAPQPTCSAAQLKLCEEARAAAAWLWIQSEVAAAFRRFSRDLLAVHTRGLNAVTALNVCRHSGFGCLSDNNAASDATAGGGARDALNSLLLLCSEAGAEADRFASALKAGVVQPLDIALEPLARAAEATECANAGALRIAKGGLEVQQAAKRLQLAEEELTVSYWEIHSAIRQLVQDPVPLSKRLKTTRPHVIGFFSLHMAILISESRGESAGVAVVVWPSC